MSGWNFADVWEVVAAQVPDAPALVHADRRISWAALDRRANGVAAAMLAAGAAEQDKVAQYLFNAPEYIESMYAAFKAGLVPINTNYRYQDDELVYLWDNADCTVVVFHGTFTPTIERIRDRVPRVTTWLWVDDGEGDCPDWAAPYEDAAASGTAEAVQGPWGRTGDQLLMTYTGGTTGMPKGVMWRQDDLFRNLVSQMNPAYRDAPEEDLALVRTQVVQPGPIGMAACPLMHGTGLYTQLIILSLGGSSVTLTSRRFDVIEMFDTIEREKVNQIAIVGDTFGKPMLKVLDEYPDRWDLSSLYLVASSGVMWSEPVKQGLLKHHPGMLLVDVFSSSEAVGMGQSVSSAGGASETASFRLGENTVVITDDGRRVEPGSGDVGRVAVGGFQPIGYYKDPEKTAATFIEFEGRRYSCPGDYARVEADGTLTLLGRGSVVINTGGEKVYPEEVEEVLKTYPGVRDAVVVGVPDDRFGEVVTAVVEVGPGDPVPAQDLITFVRGKLAAYKSPKTVLTIDTIGRAPNGKVDYKRLKAFAADAAGGA
ncbi:MAG TPA: AMP-binding protein [Acidimicrobiales bacterium]|nr:AMP-binding protein [Acidimicrobiales bacterium]